jgi:hypothetical protein
MTKTPTAPQITKHILKLALQIDATGELDRVPVQPEMDSLPDVCFENVTAIVRRRGGSIQHGWSMRELPGVFVEGEFYAVWRRPDGALQDVTPRKDGQTQILFLPDFKRIWEGEDVDNRRMMLHERPCYCGGGMPFVLCHGRTDE